MSSGKLTPTHTNTHTHKCWDVDCGDFYMCKDLYTKLIDFVSFFLIFFTHFYVFEPQGSVMLIYKFVYLCI